LFQPRPEETAIHCLQRRIERFSKVIDKFPNSIDDTIDVESDEVPEISNAVKFRVFNQSLFLRQTYILAIEEMEKGVSWDDVCKQSISNLASVGLTNYKRARTLAQFNRQ
jgi:hypothetical protein